MIAVEPRRAEALKIGYEATDWTEWPSYEAYIAAMADWDVRLIDKGGEAIGAVYTRGPEFTFLSCLSGAEKGCPAAS